MSLHLAQGVFIDPPVHPILSHAVINPDHPFPDHSIVIPCPLVEADFPNIPEANVWLHTIHTLNDLLKHGFHHPTDPSVDGDGNHLPSRNVWLRVTAQLLVSLHTSLWVSHGGTPVPFYFSNLSDKEQSSLDLLHCCLHSFSSYFHNDGNFSLDDNAICLCCLDECHISLEKAKWKSVKWGCGQNTHAALLTIFNQTTCHFAAEMNSWVENTRSSTQDTAILRITSSRPPAVADPRLDEWVSHTADGLKRQMLLEAQTHADQEAETEINTCHEALLPQLISDAEAQANAESGAYFDRLVAQGKVEAAAHADADAKLFYASCLATLKAAVVEESNQEFAAFKHNLKIQASECMDNVLVVANQNAGGPVCTDKPMCHPMPLPQAESHVSQKKLSAPPSPVSELGSQCDSIDRLIARIPSEELPTPPPVPPHQTPMEVENSLTPKANVLFLPPPSLGSPGPSDAGVASIFTMMDLLTKSFTMSLAEALKPITACLDRIDQELLLDRSMGHTMAEANTSFMPSVPTVPNPKLPWDAPLDDMPVWDYENMTLD